MDANGCKVLIALRVGEIESERAHACPAVSLFVGRPAVNELRLISGRKGKPLPYK
ncbi:unnamed protein product [Diplocarpon coronariae]|uniref:Uncharacterized protein n=1 Tax=Diplocarpon coronariae TaxID=2795749 RepID=A0A218YZ29_9HELO|nr:hypothetical protein B2J93_1079 [Marssonina coronariae]